MIRSYSSLKASPLTSQVPNIVLNTLWVENITRSKAMKEQLDMFISFDTSLEDIELLRVEMENFVRSSDNSRDFQPDIILECTGLGNMDKMQLKIEIRHKVLSSVRCMMHAQLTHHNSQIGPTRLSVRLADPNSCALLYWHFEKSRSMLQEVAARLLATLGTQHIQCPFRMTLLLPDVMRRPLPRRASVLSRRRRPRHQ